MSASIIDKEEQISKDKKSKTKQVAGDSIKKKIINPEDNVTKLAPVDPNQVYNANKDAGSILGADLEDAYLKMYGSGGWGGGGGQSPENLSISLAPRTGGGGGGGGGQENLSLSLADRSKDFMDYQGQTTGYMSNLMKGATNTANGMFGQGAYNQMTGDNDQVVQGDIQALQEQFGGDVNHPAFIKAKNALLNTARMYNARAFTDLRQKAGEYGLAVADMAKNYYDVYSTREEDQQKLKLATDQFNVETKLKQQQMAQARSQFGASMAADQQKLQLAVSEFNVETKLKQAQMAQEGSQFNAKMAMESQLSSLAAITANRKYEAGQATEWATTELEARSANKITQMNLELENKKLNVAQTTAAQQKTSGIASGLFGVLGAAVAGLAI